MKELLQKSITEVKNAKEVLDQARWFNDIESMNQLLDSAQDIYLTWVKGSNQGVFDRMIADGINIIEVMYDNLKICNDDDVNHKSYKTGESYITARQQAQLKQLKEMASKFMNEMERLGL